MSVSLPARIDEWLAAHRREIVGDLADLVGIPSVSLPGDSVAPFGQPCRDAIDHMLALGRRHGYGTHNYDYYVGAIEFVHKYLVEQRNKNRAVLLVS